MRMHNPIENIVDRFGGQNEMARRTGWAQSTIWRWCQMGRVPSGRVDEIIAVGRRQKPPILLEPNDFFCSNRRRRP